VREISVLEEIGKIYSIAKDLLPITAVCRLELTDYSNPRNISERDLQDNY
jgi:hypothetical protein